MNKRDYLTIAIITLVFAVMVFYRIGNIAAPESAYRVSGDDNAIALDFGGPVEISHINIFQGYKLSAVGLAEYYPDRGEWELLSDMVLIPQYFCWQRLFVGYQFNYPTLVIMTNEAIYNEMVVVATDGTVIVPLNADRYPGLFDEQELYHHYLSNNYYNEMIADECDHGRFAHALLNGLPTTGAGHPPLGNHIISLGIGLFGMTPFGWRFMSAIFGIMMIPLMYVFAKAVIRNYLAATAATILLAFDCMHFTLSRVATIDGFVAFFILLMYYLFFRYLQMDRELATAPPSETPSETLPRFPRSYIPLALCGLVMGLAVATKWTGVYAGLGLGLMFLYYVVKYRPPQLKRLIGFCLIFFVAVPVIIYLMAYGRMVYDPPTDGLLRTVAANTEDMLTFHATREESHHYASPFYTWPFIWKPMLYATDIVDYTRSSVVNDMGNPAVWWVGVPCLIYCLYCFARKKDKRAGFLVTSYLAQFLPWGVVMLFSNLTFLYHYYPATLFMILAIGYTLDRVAQAPKWGKAAVYGYLAAVVAMFVVFYPAISGRSTAITYLESLRWLPEWVIMVF